jgi:uncharacterized membrane protein
MPKRLLQLVASAALVFYPVAIYFGLRYDSLRWATLIVLALLAPAVYFRFKDESGSNLATFAWIPLLTATLLAVGALLDDSKYVFATPVVINAILLVGFGATLWTETPMIERFARLQTDELNQEQRKWCRLWTILWCCFFVINALIAAILALRAPMEWWALYNSLISYMLIGLLFAIERTLRWFRFEKGS